MRYVDPDGREIKVVLLLSNQSLLDTLKTNQDKVINDPNLKQGAGGPYKRTDAGITEDTTWCNQATFQTARATDSTIAKAMYNSGDSNGDNTNAKQVFGNLKVAADDNTSPIAEVCPKDAQNLANLGLTVVGVKDTNTKGHVATVAPGYNFDKTNGPMMANVGGSDKQGYTRAKDAFRENYYADGKVHFYVNKESIKKLDVVIIIGD